MTATTDLLNYVDILSCTDSVCLKAIEQNFPDLEEAILYQLALKNEVDYFITNDNAALKKLATLQLPVLSEAKFLNHYE